MKVALVLVLAFVGALAQGSEFKCTSSNSLVCKFQELAHGLKGHASKLGDSLKEVGTAVLSSALDQGKSLLANGAQAILGTVLEHLTKSGAIGKRETLSLVDKLKGHVQQGVELAKKAKEFLHKSFEQAVNKLTGLIGNFSGLKQIEDDADKQVDSVVEQFNKDGKTGIRQLVAAVSGKLRDLLTTGLSKIKALAGVKEKRNVLLNTWNSVKDAFSGVSKSLADAFKPHLDALKQGVADLADKAKAHGATLTAAAKQSITQLKDQLSKQIETLKGHATKVGSQLGTHAVTAVNALKEAVTKIAADALKNAAGTAKDGGKEKRSVILTNAWTKLREAFAGATKAIADTFKPHLDNLNKGVTDLSNQAKQSGAALTAAAKQNLQKLADDLNKKIEDIKARASKVGGAVNTQAQAAANALKEAVAKITSDALKNTAAVVKDGGKEKRSVILTNAWTKLREAFSGASKAIADTFKPHLDNLNKGVADLSNQAKQSGAALTAAAKQNLQKLADDLNKKIEDIKARASKVGGAVNTQAQAAANALKEAVAKITSDALKNTAGAMKDGGKEKRNVLANAWTRLRDAFSGASKAIADTFKPHLDNLNKGVADLTNQAKQSGAALTAAAKQNLQKLADDLNKKIEDIKTRASKVGGTVNTQAQAAANALKEAVAKITSDALKGVKDTVGK